MAKSHIRRYRVLVIITVLGLGIFSSGCTPGEEQTTTGLIQDALSAWQGNRELAVQCVSDVKKNFTPDDPLYNQIMEDYDITRDENNKYLAQVERAFRTGRADDLSENSTAGVKEHATQLLADAARGLDQSYRSQKYNVSKALTFPPAALNRAIRSFSPETRKVVANMIRDQMPWKPWSQL